MPHRSKQRRSRLRVLDTTTYRLQVSFQIFIDAAYEKDVVDELFETDLLVQ